MKYGEWPKLFENKKLVNGKIGKQLAAWLYTSHYDGNGQFKYGDELKRRLDELKSKYYVEEKSKPLPADEAAELIEAYCFKYGEWPSITEKAKTQEVNGKTGKQLATWLNGTYVRNESQYSEEFKRRLDELKSKYYVEEKSKSLSSDEAVELIEQYCMKYGEWPRPSENKKSVNGETGKQLAAWLRGTYEKNKTKYSEELIRRLDELKSKYYVEKISKPLSSDEAVELIEQYCLKYGEWPKYLGKSKTQEVNGKTGKQLAQWLYDNYEKNKAQYSEELKRRLDELKSKYYVEEKSKTLPADEAVELIEQYCMKYGEWPKKGENENVVNGKTGWQLASWLSGTYERNKAQYSQELIRRFDELKSKFYVEERAKPLSADEVVELIEQYCMKYGEWPKKMKKARMQEVNGKTGWQLATWLGITSGYNKGQFKYSEELKVKLDELKSKYYESGFTPEQYVDAIEVYCTTYQEWPKFKVKNKAANGRTGNQLADWLIGTYEKNKAQYSEELKRRLDELKARYYKAKKKFDESKKAFDEERHDKVVEKVINNSEVNSNEHQIHKPN